MSRMLNTLVAMAVAVTCTLSAPAEAKPFPKANAVEASLGIGGYFFPTGGESTPTLNHTFNYTLTGSYTFSDLLGAELALDFAPKEVNPDTFINLHLDLLIYPFVHDWFVLFFGVGPSFSAQIFDNGDMDSDPGVNGMVGLKFYPWRHVGFRVDTRYIARFATDDNAAGEKEEMGHDLLATLSLFVTFGGEDEAAEEIQLDTDGDGFLDNVDACPEEPGVASAKGCADRDGDTVRDAEDACPDTPGLVELEGCPDRDGDGVVDGKDRCVDKPGLPEYQGCPDSDGDKIADPDDRCPRIPGQAAFRGCPPPPPAEVVAKYSGVMDGITFDYDSDAIQPASFPILDEAVKILNAYPQILLLVEGHTSSEGEAKYNLDLSRRRAESVRTYMVKQGVGEKRIETVGYGADRPLDSSDSDAAREKNRRIEFKILRQ